jgi:ribose 5-phosphate isomerase B
MEGGYRPSKVFLAADHGGYEAKEQLKAQLQAEFDLVDMGPENMNPDDDFTPFAEEVARAVVAEQNSMGVLVCRSGEGMAIAANKIDGVRAALVWDQSVARETREDNDSNVLSLPADHITTDEMLAITRTWLTTPFSGAERHTRRIEQISELEDKSQ